MADNLNENINNGQRTARNFNSNVDSEMLNIFSDEKIKETYARQSRSFKTAINKARENFEQAQEALLARMEENAELSAKANERLERLEVERQEAINSNNTVRENQIRAEIASIKADESRRQTIESNLRMAESDRSDALKSILEQYRNVSQSMELEFGASLAAFDEIQQTTTEHSINISNLKKANDTIRSSMNKTRIDIASLEQELANLDRDSAESATRASEIRNTIGDLRAELNDLEEEERNNEAKMRSHRRAQRRLGLDENGNPLSEEQASGIEGSITGATAGARLGSRFGPWGIAIGGILGGAAGSFASGGSFAEGARDTYGDYEDNNLIPDRLEEIVGSLGGIGRIYETAGSILQVASAIKNQMTKYIDTAADYLKSYYGTINANLEQSSYNYKALSDKADAFLTTSRWVKQTDYLSKIAEVSNAGLLRDIETAAILETIKNKTLTSFDTTNDGIKRLIRLNESDYIRQFGIEAQLKKVLNSVFNDSGYLSSMFDSVTSAIMDAASSYSGDVTAFNSTVQTWMGFMYSSGLSSNVINQIAEGINNLGSGNLQALSGNEQVQRLFLLAMDRVGMDYADVLQQGLSLDDTNTLLGSIVKYLDEIVGNTSENNVLRSSYANLFNMSISDMRAIHQLSSQVNSIGNYAVGSGGAVSQTVNALTNTLQQSTSISEEFDNLFSNLQYTLGESIAESTGLYSVYRVADETMKVLQPFASIGGGVGTLAKVGQKAAAASQYPIVALGLINTIKDFGSSIFNNTVGGGLTAFLSSSLANSVSSADNAAITTLIANASSTSKSNSAQLKTLNRSTLVNGGLTSLTNTYTSEELNAAEEEGADVKILKEMAKTLMNTKEEGHYAFAVSLEGMNNNVLRSFASIFADEDAMMNTFKGENAAIKDSLFNYLGDNTSNSGKSDSTKDSLSSGNMSGNKVKEASKNVKSSKKKNK